MITMITPATGYLIAGLLMGGFSVFLLITLISKLVLHDYFKKKKQFVEQLSKQYGDKDEEESLK